MLFLIRCILIILHPFIYNPSIIYNHMYLVSLICLLCFLNCPPLQRRQPALKQSDGINKEAVLNGVEPRSRVSHPTGNGGGGVDGVRASAHAASRTP